MNKRVRTLPLTHFRSEQTEDGVHVISGYAATFNTLSEYVARGVRERIAPGAFTEALKTCDVRALIDHDSSKVIGRLSAGTLRLEEDQIGLKYEVTLPDTQVARDLLVSVARGDIRENSFAFTVSPEHIVVERVSDTESIETVTKVDRLFEISIVSFPAYPSSAITSFRSEDHEIREHQTVKKRTFEAVIAAELAKLSLQTQSIDIEV